jgi:Holliday junction resolvase RusA-like endonuclease
MSDLGITFRVLASALPQPRPKARRIGKGIQIYTPNSVKIKEYKDAIRAAFSLALDSHEDKEALLVAFQSWPVQSTIACVFKDPSPTRASYDAIEGKGLSRYHQVFHTKKPDVDNLEKGVLDALKGLAWKDDSYVVCSCTHKAYTPFSLGGASGRKVISGESYLEVYLFYSNPDEIQDEG